MTKKFVNKNLSLDKLIETTIMNDCDNRFRTLMKFYRVSQIATGLLNLDHVPDNTKHIFYKKNRRFFAKDSNMLTEYKIQSSISKPHFDKYKDLLEEFYKIFYRSIKSIEITEEEICCKLKVDFKFKNFKITISSQRIFQDNFKREIRILKDNNFILLNPKVIPLKLKTEYYINIYKR
jgi:hypothetical protein